MSNIISRNEAIELVNKFKFFYEKEGAVYSLVSLEDTIKLFGLIDPDNILIEQLKKDPIRGISPKKDSFYYWNVADYLSTPRKGPLNGN